MPAASVDRSRPPHPAPLGPFHPPPFLRRTLPSGLEVYAARFPGVPLVVVELLAPAGAENDPPGGAGLATLTGALLDEGTRQRSSMEIALQLESLGGQLSSGADWDVGYVATGLLARDLGTGLELLAEVATDPSFPEQEVERVRRQRLTELMRRGHQPSLLADDCLFSTIYAGTAYAHPLAGTEADVSALSRRHLAEFYQARFSLRGASLVAVGDLEPERLLHDLEALFPAASTAAAHEPPAAPPLLPPRLPGISVHVVDRPGSSQTELRLGHAGVPRTHPDFTPLVVMNTLLGGKFTSRINLNLRERHGFTYGATTRFHGRLGPGPFVFSAAVATESTGAAAREVLFELRRIREEKVTPAELEETVSYLLGVFPYTFQTVDDLAKRLEDLAIYRFPEDHWQRYAERVSAVTIDDVLAVAGRHLHPESLALVAVGPATVLAPQLNGLGPLTVHRRDAGSGAAEAGAAENGRAAS
jgi:zinc protease